MRTKTGIVVSAKQDKTIIVKVDRKVAHPIYKKSFIKSKKFHVHDPENKYNEGDTVTFRESAPISKNKHWVVVTEAETKKAA